MSDQPKVIGTIVLNDEERACLAIVEAGGIVTDAVLAAWRFSYPFAGGDVQGPRLAYGMETARRLQNWWRDEAPKQRASETTMRPLTWTEIDALLYLLRIATLVALDTPSDESAT